MRVSKNWRPMSASSHTACSSICWLLGPAEKVLAVVESGLMDGAGVSNHGWRD